MKVILLALLLMLASGPGFGLEERSVAAEKSVPQINNRGHDLKKFGEQVGVAVVEAARSSPRRIKLLNFESNSPAEGQTVWKIKMEYYGSITGKRFESDVTVKIDTSKQDAWEISDIEYGDNNRVSLGKPNLKQVRELIPKMTATKPPSSPVVAPPKPPSSTVAPAEKAPNPAPPNVRQVGG